MNCHYYTFFCDNINFNLIIDGMTFLGECSNGVF